MNVEMSAVLCQNNLLPAAVHVTGFRGGVLPAGLGGPDTKATKGFIVDW